MQCEVCKAAEATIHVKQIVDGAARELHVCQACATQQGVAPATAFNLSDLLLGLKGAPAVAAAVPDVACPDCHMRLSDFRRGGRLGCPSCYEAFAAEIGPALAGMHRGLTHTGKAPASERAAQELRNLRRELDAAVVAQRFEEAAILRDRLREMTAKAGEEDAACRNVPRA